MRAASRMGVEHAILATIWQGVNVAGGRASVIAQRQLVSYGVSVLWIATLAARARRIDFI